jgi:hypothetical protein
MELLKSDFFIALFGVVVGGIISYKTTSSSLKKQFNYEIKTTEIQDLKLQIRAIQTIINEIEHNSALAYKASDVAKKQDDQVGIKLSEGYFEFEFSAWETYRVDIIHLIHGEETLTRLGWIYYQVKIFNQTRVGLLESLDSFNETSASVKLSLRELLNNLKSRLSDLNREFENVA